LLACFRRLAERGTTLVLSSHQMWQIESLCKEFCIIGAGRVRARGTLAELRGMFPTRTVRVAPDLPAIRSAFERAGAPAPLALDDALQYELPATTDFGALLRVAVEAGPVSTFERHEPSLHAIYVHALDAAHDGTPA
jgi:ABC-2 type transport system ATP-binding protein